MTTGQKWAKLGKTEYLPGKIPRSPGSKWAKKGKTKNISFNMPKSEYNDYSDTRKYFNLLH